MQIAFVGLYFTVLLLLCTYGLHRAHLVLLLWRHRGQVRRACELPPVGVDDLPRVTIQLPLYNEATVVTRLLRGVASIEYPRDRLEIQVLDDSSDETRHIASRTVDELRAAGYDANYLRRGDRHGYKAGALDFGLRLAKGELVAIFDADFIPQSNFLMAVVGHFRDPSVGMVQTRWAHLNRDAGLLTRVQALMLDGHHLVENQARFGAGCFFNFSGTGGVWRRKAIDAAGGWQHDTLTEDLDLSYRAQLAGWKFVYRPDVVTPAELPEDMSALRAQQFRWAKGTVQTARKLLPGIIANRDLKLSQRIEAAFHMLPHFAYPLMLLLSVLLLPALILMPATDLRTMLVVDLPLCLGATGSLITFYAMAERAQGRSAWQAVANMPSLIALGAGLSPYLTQAVIEGSRTMAGEFVRTPKRGKDASRYKQATKWPFVEIGLGCLSAASVVAAVQTDHWVALPFASLFMLGYFYVAARLVTEQLVVRQVAQLPSQEHGIDVDPSVMAPTT
jgi:cellulose synthase/poly-beta-1,6-N-acetylglucosamine synthase-like glycosyltransferase